MDVPRLLKILGRDGVKSELRTNRRCEVSSTTHSPRLAYGTRHTHMVLGRIQIRVI